MTDSARTGIFTGQDFKKAAGGALAGLLCAAVVAAVLWHRVPETVADWNWYDAMADGRFSEVGKPFVSRILYPMFAGFLKTRLHLGSPEAFRLAGFICLSVLGTATGALIALSGRGLWLPLTLLTLATPSFVEFFTNAYLPDVGHAALVALFFLLLCKGESSRGAMLAGAVILALSFLARESSLPLAVAAVGLAIADRRRCSAVIFACAGIAGWLAVGYASKLGKGNIHQMNELAYLAFKVPYNFTKNVLGIPLWTNTFADAQPDFQPPVWVTDAPKWLPLGSIKKIGVCAPEIGMPLSTLTLMLSLFGTAPAIAWFRLRQLRYGFWKETPPWVSLVQTYGWLAFFLGPCIGASVSRLLGYAWPAFFVAAPASRENWLPGSKSALITLAILHIVAAWLPLAASHSGIPWRLLMFGVPLTLALIHWRTFVILRRHADRAAPQA